jgi:hypothetical protein
MNCSTCEDRLSDYLENSINPGEREAISQHLRFCQACNELMVGMKEVIAWGSNFPRYDAPVWLPARILASTPVIARERWFDTLASLGRWVIEPRTAMAIFTATVVCGWLGSIAEISPDWTAVVRDPTSLYYQAVRAYYRLPLITEIHSQIEQFLEAS